MKRRTLIALGLGSLGLGVWQYYLPVRGNRTVSPTPLPELTTEPLFRFAAIGDVGTGAWGQFAVAEALSQRWQTAPFERVMMTGDNIYPNGEIEKIQAVFERPYANLLANGVQFFAALGNHDFRTHQGRDQVNYPGYNMADRYYTFTQQSAQFFVLDTNVAKRSLGEAGAKAWQVQRDWLQAELARSQAQWKVVYAHHPVYSSGRHGSNDKLIAELTPLFADYGVQLYLNGHDHNYERSQPLKGTTYLTTGNGAKLRPVGQSDWTAYSSSVLGFNLFEVHPDRMVVKAIDTDNRVYDEAHLYAAPVQG